jgi:L-iditol 2-dehydrogenase
MQSTVENKAAVLNTLRQFEFEDRPLPKAGPKNVVLRIHTVGICGSDVHYWAHGKCGPFEVNGPLILGHESSGIVESVGEGVRHLKPGDRVAIEPGVPCRYCKSCRIGQYNLCPDVQFLATPPYNGSLTNFIEHPADFCYVMPDHMTFEEGALLEPLSVGVHACRRGEVRAGSHVLITGAGPIGLVLLLVARASGATKIIVTDMMEGRLEVAKKMGADAVFKADDPDVVNKIKAVTENITQSFECSGASSALVLAIRATSQGGKLMSIGRSAAPMQSIPLFEAADKEIDIIGSFRYSDTYPQALELVATGQINVKPLVTHRYSLLESQKAFEQAETGADGAIKIAIKVSNDNSK